MRIIKLLLCCLLSFTTVIAIATSEQNEFVKQTIAAFMKENDVPGVAVEIYNNGDPASYYFGYANLEHKKSITKDTIFELGSISKIMTSLLLAQQVDLAQVNLNDSVRKYITTLPNDFDHIKLQDLATHTSGLPYDVPEIKSREALETYLNQTPIEIADTDEWIYSNFGVGLLGYALETVTHKNFDQLYQRYIVTPLGMKPIALTVPKTLNKFCAQGYSEEGKPVPASALGVFPAAYGLKASSDDMRRFLRAAIGLPGTPERILYPMRLTQSAYLKLPNKMQGLAWQLTPIKANHLEQLLTEPNNIAPVHINEINDKPFYASDVLIDKTGMTDGFRTYIAVLPNKKSGIVILANKSVNNDDIVHAGRKILFELAKPEPSTEAPKDEHA